jgi:hypothetical protein
VIISLLWFPAAWAYSLNGRLWERDYPTEEGFELNSSSFPEDFVDPGVLEERYALGISIWNTQGEAVLHIPYGGLNDDLQHGDGNNDHNTTMYTEYYEGTALAKARHNAIDGALTDCDIAIYRTNLSGVIPWSFDYDGAPEGHYDFAHTVIHELGHCIGIAHSEYEAAVMYGSSTKGSAWEKRDLHADDIAAIQALYGVAEVHLYIDSWWVEDADADGKLGPGEAGSLVVQLGTDSTAHAYDVIGSLDAKHPALFWSDTAISLGDLAPQNSEESQLATLRFGFQVAEDCQPYPPIPFRLTIEDVAGHQLNEEGHLVLNCPFELSSPRTLPAGCGCTNNPRGLGWTGLIGLVLLARRRGPLEQR